MHAQGLRGTGTVTAAKRHSPDHRRRPSCPGNVLSALHGAMANHIQHSLDVLEFDEAHVKDALHCLLHTIFFNRALGMVQPREVDAEGRLDVYWVECNDPQVEETVRRRVDEFAAWLAQSFRKAPDQPQLSVVTVQFF